MTSHERKVITLKHEDDQNVAKLPTIDQKRRMTIREVAAAYRVGINDVRDAVAAWAAGNTTAGLRSHDHGRGKYVWVEDAEAFFQRRAAA